MQTAYRRFLPCRLGSRGDNVDFDIPVIHGVREKVVVLTDYIQKSGISPSELMYVGNEINDLECLKFAGVAVVPRDAHSCVQKVATVRLKTRGGYGVSRELAEILSRVRG